MQIKSRLFRFITVIVLTVCGILALVFLEFAHTPTQPSDFPVPEDAELILSIDARELTKEDLKELIFLKNDARLVGQLIGKIKARKEKPNSNLSIDILHRIAFYTVQRHGTSYLAFLFYVSNEKDFLRTAPTLSHSSYATKDGVAIIVTPLAGNKKAEKSLAATLLNAPLLKQGKSNSLSLIDIATGKRTSVLPGLKASVHITGHKLLISGTFQNTGKQESEFSVKQTGLFIHSTILPQKLLDSLSAHIPTVKLKIPNVRYIDVDYNGIVIDNSDGIKALPRINSVIGSDQAISVESILAEIPEKYKKGDSIMLPGLTYVLRQLDDHTIFFGINPNSVLKKRSKDVMCIDGQLGTLMEIDASPMILSVIEIVAPQIRPAREFAASTEQIHICAGKNGSNTIEASILFKKDKSAYVEFTRLFLELQAINE